MPVSMTLCGFGNIRYNSHALLRVAAYYHHHQQTFMALLMGKGKASRSVNPPSQPLSPPQSLAKSHATIEGDKTGSGSGIIEVVEGASVTADHGIIQSAGTLSAVRTDTAVDPCINKPKDANARQTEEDK
ncbi:hypothetical protein BDQ17DRAFT_1431256 [Cyathus striatus]|nr:hypothetical protein BDQ17DRAFT_1431256 [Cyathus striatus]